MIENIPRISVRIISYNQEELICRALDSLIAQRDYLYEVCIRDDCSTDLTYEVLLDYQRRYPDLIKVSRNEHNLGIFENIEVSWTLPTGDLIYTMAGDDAAGEGYFKAVVEFIKEKKIDWKNEFFCIYGDYMQISSDNTKTIFHQNLVNDKNAIKLLIRKLIGGRSACYSKKILEKFEKVSEGRSFRVELAQNCQLQLFSEHNYYLPALGNIYYAEIGISSRMSKADYVENTIKGYDYFINFVTNHGYQIDKKDMAYIDYMKAYRNGNKKKALKYYLKSIDLSLGFKGLNLDRIFFVLKKKSRNK